VFVRTHSSPLYPCEFCLFASLLKDQLIATRLHCSFSFGALYAPFTTGAIPASPPTRRWRRPSVTRPTRRTCTVASPPPCARTLAWWIDRTHRRIASRSIDPNSRERGANVRAGPAWRDLHRQLDEPSLYGPFDAKFKLCEVYVRKWHFYAEPTRNPHRARTVGSAISRSSFGTAISRSRPRHHASLFIAHALIDRAQSCLCRRSNLLLRLPAFPVLFDFPPCLQYAWIRPHARCLGPQLAKMPQQNR